MKRFNPGAGGPSGPRPQWAAAGVLAPVLFTGIVVLAGALRPGYSHLHQLISELGAHGTPYAHLMNYGGFIPTGLLLAAFAASTRLLAPRDSLAALGTVLLFAFAVAVTVAGLVSCDAGCPIAVGSLANIVHGLAAPVALMGGLGAMGCFGWALRRRPDTRLLGTYSLISALVGGALMILLALCLPRRSWVGLYQRLLLATLFLWCVVVAVRLLFGAGRRAG